MSPSLDERHEFRMHVQVFSELAAEASRLRDGQAAALGPRAAHDVGDGVRARGPEASGLQPLIELLERSDFHPPEEDVLPDGQSRGAVGIRLREIREHVHLPRRHVAERQTHGHVHEPGLALQADVGVQPCQVRIGEGLQPHRSRHDARAVDFDAGRGCASPRRSMAPAAVPRSAPVRRRHPWRSR